MKCNKGRKQVSSVAIQHCPLACSLPTPAFHERDRDSGRSRCSPHQDLHLLLGSPRASQLHSANSRVECLFTDSLLFKIHCAFGLIRVVPYSVWYVQAQVLLQYFYTPLLTPALWIFCCWINGNRFKCKESNINHCHNCHQILKTHP